MLTLGTRPIDLDQMLCMAASSLRRVFVDLDRVDIGVRGIKERRLKMKLSIALGTITAARALRPIGADAFDLYQRADSSVAPVKKVKLPELVR